MQRNRFPPRPVLNDRPRYCAVQPPSIESSAPLLESADGEHRNAANPAICSTVTNSLLGCAARITSFTTASRVMLRALAVSPIWPSTSGVWTYPGQIRLVRTPNSAPSSAVVLVNPARPCLAETYADLNGEATLACADPMLSIRPHFLDFMYGSARRVVWKAEDRLRAMIRSHLATGNSSRGETNCVPALLTRISTPPNDLAASAIISWISSGLVRSALEKAALTL